MLHMLGMSVNYFSMPCYFTWTLVTLFGKCILSSKSHDCISKFVVLLPSLISSPKCDITFNIIDNYHHCMLCINKCVFRFSIVSRKKRTEIWKSVDGNDFLWYNNKNKDHINVVKYEIFYNNFHMSFITLSCVIIIL